MFPDCGKCNLLFKMAKDLKAHMILHDAKKTHSCNQCGFSSIRADKLKRHMLVHSGEKPFSCAHCNHFFSGDKHTNLFICLYSVPAFMHNTRKSKDTYSNTLHTYCTQCKYSYTTDGALKLHIQIFSCAQCNYSCTRAGTLKTHTYL